MSVCMCECMCVYVHTHIYECHVIYYIFKSNVIVFYLIPKLTSIVATFKPTAESGLPVVNIRTI